MSLFVCPCKAPSQPRCVGHHGLQSGLPSPSSPTEMGIPFLPGHPTCSPPSGEQPLCLHPAQYLCPSAVFAGFLYVCNPAGATAEGFLGVPRLCKYLPEELLSWLYFPALPLFRGVPKTLLPRPDTMPPLFHRAAVTQQCLFSLPCSLSCLSSTGESQWAQVILSDRQSITTNHNVLEPK